MLFRIPLCPGSCLPAGGSGSRLYWFPCIGGGPGCGRAAAWGGAGIPALQYISASISFERVAVLEVVLDVQDCFVPCLGPVPTWHRAKCHPGWSRVSGLSSRPVEEGGWSSRAPGLDDAPRSRLCIGAQSRGCCGSNDWRWYRCAPRSSLAHVGHPRCTRVCWAAFVRRAVSHVSTTGVGRSACTNERLHDPSFFLVGHLKSYSVRVDPCR